MRYPDRHGSTSARENDVLASITVFQARKCAAIIQAYRDGQGKWGEHVGTVEKFLHAAAFEGEGLGWVMRPSSSELWDLLSELPWPALNGTD